MSSTAFTFSSGQASGDYDVAVVGGGVSGAFVAWRLREAGGASPVLGELARRRGGKLRVALFEYSSRIGGRLYSETLPGIPHRPVELGGMRFLSSHVRVKRLVDKFGLSPFPLRVQDEHGNGLYYLRGRRFTSADLKRPGFVPPYLLDRGERGRSPGELLIEVALRHRDQADRLRQVGFRNLLLNELSAEAYQFVRDASGYDTIVNNWSAAEAIPFLLADFDPQLEYFALQEGFQALPRTLVERFLRAGGQAFGNHRLFRLDSGREGIHLEFDVSASSPSNPHRNPNPARCTARHVILAMPRRSIELLHPESVLFENSQFSEDVQAVLPQPGFKIFTAYRRPWWYHPAETTVGRSVKEGRSVTDLPVRQCYYWHTGTSATAERPESSLNSSLMASYSDGGSVEFWAGLARHPQPYAPPTNVCPPGVPIPDPDPELSCSAAMVAELQDQLRELHGINSLTGTREAGILAPYVALFRDWSIEPFGGGWHFWRVGTNARRVMNRIRQPLPDRPIYLCGEAWSRQQGWVEGALESADEVLEEVLRMPRPDWLL